MSVKTNHLESLIKNDAIAVERLAALTRERDLYPNPSVQYTKWDALVVEFTAKTANGTLAVAAQTAIEVN
jgi:hypothetical protein